MVKQVVMITNPTGLHLRPAGLFCKTAMQFPCNIMFQAKNSQANAKSVLSVLGACVKRGDSIEIMCDGENEEEALRVMVDIVESGLGE